MSNKFLEKVAISNDSYLDPYRSKGGDAPPSRTQEVIGSGIATGLIGAAAASSAYGAVNAIRDRPVESVIKGGLPVEQQLANAGLVQKSRLDLIGQGLKRGAKYGLLGAGAIGAGTAYFSPESLGLSKRAASNEQLRSGGNEPMMPHINRAMGQDASTGGKVGALIGSGLGVAAGIAAHSPWSAVTGAALGGLGGWIGGSLTGGAVGIPHGIVNSMIAERQLRQDTRAKEESNRYLQKVANNLTEVPISGWNPDSYARKLGWEDPRKAALHAGAMSLAMAPPRSGDGSMGHNVSTAAMTALNASSAHTEAEEFNQRLREILEAQEHGVRTGDMSLHHELKEDLMEDPHASMWGGRVAGGIIGAMTGGAAANVLGASPLGIGAGALIGGGLVGWGMGAMGQAGAEYHNDHTEGLLRAREAYLRAKLVKSASFEQAINSGKTAMHKFWDNGSHHIPHPTSGPSLGHHVDDNLSRLSKDIDLKDTRNDEAFHNTMLIGALTAPVLGTAAILHHNKTAALLKKADEQADQARIMVRSHNQSMRPYYNVSPEVSQAVQAGVLGTGAYLASKGLSHVHAGFGKAAPYLAGATALASATGIGSAIDHQNVRDNQDQAAQLRESMRVFKRSQELAKQAEDSIPHDYKPGLAAGAIDAGMGVGLGSLGAYISKKHFGGKYAPLLIGGMEGAAAMTATDIFQRKHEKEMHDALTTH